VRSDDDRDDVDEDDDDDVISAVDSDRSDESANKPTCTRHRAGETVDKYKLVNLSSTFYCQFNFSNAWSLKNLKSRMYSYINSAHKSRYRCTQQHRQSRRTNSV